MAYTDEAARLIGTPRFGGILVVSDHASARVPDDIDLGIDPALLGLHIAVDIGVAGVADIMCQRPGIAGWMGNVSRLVCDYNRDAHLHAAIFPQISDGHAIPGNAMDEAGHAARLARFYDPYHAGLEQLLMDAPPALILSLHSFTPQLATHPDQARPWHVGVLYNADERAARIAIPLLQAEVGPHGPLVVGDQQPYSGKVLNATMNRHAEADGRPYLGIEIRQDLITTPAGQAEWAERLARICNQVAITLGE
ncbi:N-formylglutamate amidohydrolase [Novosphingobium sp. FSY-8]|uniref:N-formylglutamate amidohydrolase n=1 Tax=Novosphingobium ovatum TaxID=1908523 RepID=A0ABW9XAL4_9SPHN|nr:N-formylglutamate amidohydrolase [Novosphingobium ovatum]NBC35568.1 N-formylglutamate amidohydrolase [Novosphingobium ovatum]